MRHNAKLDALVTRNIGDLEAAILHVRDTTDARLFKIMLALAKQTLNAADWHVQLDDEDTLWMAPRSWLVAGSKPIKARGWFEIYELFEEDEVEAETWLGAFVGATGVPKIALYFEQDQLGKLAWKKLVRSQPHRIDELVANGFSYSLSEGEFYFAMIIDQDELAKGFEDGIPEQAFQPWQDALAGMVRSAPLFELLGAGLVETAATQGEHRGQAGEGTAGRGVEEAAGKRRRRRR